MNLRASTHPLFLVAVITACTTMLHASAISGDIPFAGVSVSMIGANLGTATMLSGTDTRTSGVAEGDFSVIPLGTQFGPFSLNPTNLTEPTFSTGGGFSISNAGYGSFVAASGSILAQATNALVVDMDGAYTPGPLFVGLTTAPADATLAFTRNGTSISASFTLVTTPVPEPGTLVTMGIGLCGTALMLRRKPRHR